MNPNAATQLAKMTSPAVASTRSSMRLAIHGADRSPMMTPTAAGAKTKTVFSDELFKMRVK
jgi:hypothetical protein